MKQTLENQVYSWLQRLKIPVSSAYLKKQLLSHTDYPSLLSITDTLDELGIENAAFEISKDRLFEVPIPFLVHLKSNGGEFVVAQTRDDLDKQVPKFYDRWNGVVVIAEKPDGWQHKENTEWLHKERTQSLKIITSVVLLICFVLLSAFSSFHWMQITLLLIASGGIFISWLIVSKDLGIENKIADQVCSKEVDCDAVIQSKGAKLPLGISWSDVGIIWFSFLLFITMISSFSENTSGIYDFLSIFALLSLPFTFFSVYYQWRVVQKWCRLCLLTVTLLWAQFFVLLPTFLHLGGQEVPALNSILMAGTILFITAAIWFWIKPLLKRK